MNRTQRDIIDAFNRLISKMPFENITTSMIIQEAMISRATFYRYFIDKYDVMNSNFRYLLNQCIEKSKSYQEMLYNIFVNFEKNWKPLLNFFDSTGINSLTNYMYDYSVSVVEKITRQNRNHTGLTEEERFQLDLFCHGFIYISQKWICKEYNLTASQVTELVFDMAPESLKYYWFVETN